MPAALEAENTGKVSGRRMEVSTVLETRHLRLVVAVAEEGTVTGAGVRLHLTQSAVSHQLLDLEDRLGIRLFARERRRLVLMPAGAALVSNARRILRELGYAEVDARLGGRTSPNRVRLATECHTSYRWLPSALSRFEQRFPGVELDFTLDSLRTPIDALLRGDVDVVVGYSKVQDCRVTTRALFADEIVVVMHPDDHLAARSFLELRDIAERRIFADDSVTQELDLRTSRHDRACSEPRQVKLVPLTEAVIELVSARLGIGILGKSLVYPYLASGKLVAKSLPGEGLFRGWQALTLASVVDDPVLSALVDTLGYEGSRFSRPSKVSSAPSSLSAPSSRRPAAAGAELKAAFDLESEVRTDSRGTDFDICVGV